MRRSVTLIILVAFTGTGCSSTHSPGDAVVTASPATDTQAPLTPEQFESLMAGVPNDFPPPPDQQHRDAYLTALERVNPELVEDRDPDALVNRAVDQCRDIKERPEDQWLTWVKTRFGSEEHPNGFDDETSAQVLAVIRKYICPSY